MVRLHGRKPLFSTTLLLNFSSSIQKVTFTFLLENFNMLFKFSIHAESLLILHDFPSLTLTDPCLFMDLDRSFTKWNNTNWQHAVS